MGVVIKGPGREFCVCYPGFLIPKLDNYGCMVEHIPT